MASPEEVIIGWDVSEHPEHDLRRQGGSWVSPGPGGIAHRFADLLMLFDQLPARTLGEHAVFISQRFDGVWAISSMTGSNCFALLPSATVEPRNMPQLAKNIPRWRQASSMFFSAAISATLSERKD